MTFAELLEQLKQHENTDEYKTYVNGLLNADRVNTYLSTDDGKKLLQPLLDKYHSKSLDSWKTNNLEKLVNEELLKKNPNKTPEALELEKLKQQFENLQKEASRKELLLKAQKFATDKGIDVSLVEYFIGQDEESTTKNLETFDKLFKEKLGAAVDVKLKSQSYVPPKSEDMDKLTGVERAFYESNPNYLKNK